LRDLVQVGLGEHGDAAEVDLLLAEAIEVGQHLLHRVLPAGVHPQAAEQIDGHPHPVEAVAQQANALVVEDGEVGLHHVADGADVRAEHFSCAAKVSQ
jgi:hypothetical protein